MCIPSYVLSISYLSTPIFTKFDVKPAKFTAAFLVSCSQKWQ